MWYLIRFYAVAVIPALIVDIEIIFLVAGLSLFHAKSGSESIVCDYVHSYHTQLLLLIFLRLIFLKIIFCIIELFL